MATALTYAGMPCRLVVLIAFGLVVLVYEFGKHLAILASGYVAVSGIWWLIKLMVGGV